MSFTITRRQLYDLAWSEPMRSLAKKIGISDVAVAKHCHKLGVPVPERGYWNKLHAGKPALRIKLQDRDLATINRVTMSGALDDDLRSRIKGEPGEDGPDGEPVEVLTERLRNRLGSVRPSKDFSIVHPAVAAFLKRDEQATQKYAQYGYSWHKPVLSDPLEKRRLLIINGLFLGFAKVGAMGWLRKGDREQDLGIQMGDSNFGFRLGKPQHARRGRTEADEPDRLVLSIAHSAHLPGIVTEWRDESGSRLEQRLSEIIAGMAVAGHHLHQHGLAQHAKWKREYEARQEQERQQRIADAKRREEERLAALAKARVDGLIQDAAAWRDAANIRAYVAAVRQADLPSISPATLEAWTTWALAEADRLDPITSGRIKLPESAAPVDTTFGGS